MSKKKTIDKSYSLSEGVFARAFQRPLNLTQAPPFSRDAGKATNIDFQNCLKSRKQLGNSIFVPPVGIDHNTVLNHFFDFLDRRLLSSALELCGGATSSEPSDSSVKLPGNIQTKARTALDMILHECPSSVPDKPGWVRFSFLPNHWFDEGLKGFWKRSFHGSWIQNLYSVLYHGGLAMSTSTWGTMLEGRPGIYTHDNFADAASYAMFSQIGLPGVWFRVVFEVARRFGDSYPERLGSNKKQCVSVPVNIVLLAVWVNFKPTNELDDSDMLFYHKKMWSPSHEADPQDEKLPDIFRIRQHHIDMRTFDFLLPNLKYISDQKQIWNDDLNQS